MMLSRLLSTPFLVVKPHHFRVRVVVGSGRATSVREVAQTVIAAFGEAGVRSELSFNGQVRAGDPFSLVADPSRLQALGFECHVSSQQGIADYVHDFLAPAHVGRSG